MPDYNFVSAFVGIAGCVVAIVTLLIKGSDNSNAKASHDASISTQLSFIAEDVKDIKADQRAIQREIRDVRELAIEAKSSAEAAHRRLDRAGVDISEHDSTAKGDSK